MANYYVNSWGWARTYGLLLTAVAVVFGAGMAVGAWIW